MILAGDIGGTHARLALYDVSEDRLIPVRHEVYPSRHYLNLREVVQKFMTDSGAQVDAACFGVAGPVLEDRVVTSNLPWVVQRKVLQEVLNTQSVWLLNDLEAATHGIDELSENELFELNPGKAVRGNRALLFAGTGLGEALSIWSEGRYVSSSSEGGHSDFSPKDRAEMELCEFLSKTFGHVSWERVLSGHGIFNLYRFFKLKEPLDEPAWFLEEMKGADPSVAIMRAALTGESHNCVRARDLFIQFLGREAGNLALKGLATGGIYLGGGIASRIADLLKGPKFLDEFSDKGRMSELLSNIPVRVILSDDVGLVGAARFAVQSKSHERERKAA
jgi:glucokinase